MRETGTRGQRDLGGEIHAPSIQINLDRYIEGYTARPQVVGGKSERFSYAAREKAMAATIEGAIRCHDYWGLPA